MLIHKNALQLIGVADDDPRYNGLSGLKVDAQGRVYACDGSMLLRYTPQEEVKTEEFPIKANGLPVDASELAAQQEPCLIPGPLVKDALKGWPKQTSRYSAVPILDHAVVGVREGQTVLSATNLQSTFNGQQASADLVYPEVERFMEDKPCGATGILHRVTLAADLLITLAQTAKKALGGPKQVGITFSFPVDQTQQIRVQVDTSDNTLGRIDGVMMPMEIGTEEMASADRVSGLCEALARVDLGFAHAKDPRWLEAVEGVRRVWRDLEAEKKVEEPQGQDEEAA